jgi:hypothetical protein
MILSKPYLIAALALLVIEIGIALFVHDTFVRPIGGDFLVVILMYTAVRGLTRFKLYPVLIGVLLFSYLIETLQYFNYVELLGLEQIKIARVVMGTGFSWIDMLAYTAGALFILIIETKINSTLSK